MLKPAGSFTTFAKGHFDYSPRPVLASRSHLASVVLCQPSINILGLANVDAQVQGALNRINVEHNFWPTGRSRTA